MESVGAGFERKEHFEVVVQPSLREMAHVVNGDFCVVQELDMNCVAVISNIMAQTVALDSYSDTVDELLAHFASINGTVTQTGNFTEMEKDNLFRVVAQNNSIFIDLSSKLGIKDRSDTAWNLSQYDQVHEVCVCDHVCVFAVRCALECEQNLTKNPIPPGNAKRV